MSSSRRSVMPAWLNTARIGRFRTAQLQTMVAPAASATGRENASMHQAEDAVALTHQAHHQVTPERNRSDAAANRRVDHQTRREAQRPVVGTQAGQMVFDASGVAAQQGGDGTEHGALHVGVALRSAAPAAAVNACSRRWGRPARARSIVNTCARPGAARQLSEWRSPHRVGGMRPRCRGRPAAPESGGRGRPGW